MLTPELRQLRYIVCVAEEGSLTRAAQKLHVAQQALSHQVKAVEKMIGVTLFRRHARGVEPTRAGAVFVQEARRILNAGERGMQRVQAAARGEVGELRIAYTLAVAYETLPALTDAVSLAHPALKLRTQEVFGGDLPQLLRDGRYELGIAPHVVPSGELRAEAVRHEPFMVAVAEDHPLARRDAIEVADLRGEAIELWPREMAPGYHDAVSAACRGAGFDPRIDESAGGSTVWGNIAGGRGVGLVVGSLAAQLPRGIALLELTEAPLLTIDAVWHAEQDDPVVARFAEIARGVAAQRGWLTRLPAGRRAV